MEDESMMHFVVVGAIQQVRSTRRQLEFSGGAKFSASCLYLPCFLRRATIEALITMYRDNRNTPKYYVFLAAGLPTGKATASNNKQYKLIMFTSIQVISTWVSQLFSTMRRIRNSCNRHRHWLWSPLFTISCKSIEFSQLK